MSPFWRSAWADGDAFNAVDADVAVITSIGLDHQAFLGDTREAIGGEKAGILRAGQRVVFGQNMPESVYARCRALGLTPRCWGEDFLSQNVTGEPQWALSRSDGETISVPQTRLAAHNIAVACEAVADVVELNEERMLRCTDLAIPEEWISAKRKEECGCMMSVTIRTEQSSLWESW